MLKDTVIFSLTTNVELTKKVCNKLKIKPGKVKLEFFADGEVLTQAIDSVRGKDVYVIQSTCSPTNQSLMELFIFIDSLKRASAKTINVVIPYYGYARQDRKAKGRQPITSKLIADLLTTSGATKVITFDLHTPQIQGFFSIPTDNIKGMAVIMKKLKKMKIKDLCVASPDYGGMERARSLANKLGKDIPMAVIDKVRHAKNESKVMGIFGDVKGKNVVIVDDMIDTGGTIAKAVDSFIAEGAKKVYIACTHAVFSNDAVERITSTKVEKIFVTDTIELSKEKQHKKIEVITVADFLADIIVANQTNKSITEVYEKYNK